MSFHRGAQKGPAIVCRHERRAETQGTDDARDVDQERGWVVREGGFGRSEKKRRSLTIFFALPQMNRRNDTLQQIK